MKKLIIGVFAVLLSACSTSYTAPSPELNTNLTVFIMPMENQSNTPLANIRAEQLLASTLAEQGVKVKLYPKSQVSELAASLDPSARVAKATAWLDEQTQGYVMSGSVQEWHYKNGLDGEPSVGITLTLSELNGEPLWRGSASESGWGRQALSAIGLNTIEDLISQLDWQ